MPLFLFLLCLTAPSWGAEHENINYYLGVLADGYPASMVIGEFTYAKARVINMADNMILFGITEKTTLTTFLKNLPFLAEVYIDSQDIKGNPLLLKNPLVQEFLALARRDKTESLLNTELPAQTPPKITTAKGAQNPTTPNNMLLIDQLIRQKAKELHTTAAHTEKE